MSWTDSYDLKQELYASAATVVVRASRISDGRAVVVKKPCGARPTTEAIGNLRREYDILKSLDIAEVARVLGFETSDGSAALIVEDGGEPVRTFPRKTAVEITDFLQAATAIARAVQAIHAKGVVHRDLKPQHLLLTGDSSIKVIDFGLSTRLIHEYCQWVDVDSIEGTLAYMAPEQTGRLNRAVDRRSDLYSLGVTFFEMVTGQLPFDARDPLEIVHCHIAKAAPRVDKLCSAIPPIVASIIEKLLAKDPEDRYQTAAGLAADLERCLADWRQSGAIEQFELGSSDVSDILLIPQKLYGRERALSELRESFEAACAGVPQLVLISGPSGVGKSTLIGHLQRQVVLRGRFASGKFDALNRSEPYAALVAACRELVRSILTAGTDEFALTKRALLDVLGPGAGVITDLIPELEMIVGPQPAPPALGPVESQNRFERAFDDFLSALVTKRMPVVLFLDDLQWADSASLRLLRLILTSRAETRPLLVLGSYRGDDIFEAHPLMAELQRIRKGKTVVRELALSPLQHGDVSALVADALSRSVSDVQPLAAVLFKKTHGNPFELGQCLGALHRDGLVYANSESRRWEWNLDAIRTLEVMDDVAEIVVRRLHALPEAVQRLLSLAASIGYELDGDTLAAVSDMSDTELRDGLAAALREEILVPVDGGAQHRARSQRYRFAHDRVRHAAYELLPKDRRAAVHLRFGRYLQKDLGDDSSDEHWFAVAHQMNLGAEQIVDPAERRVLAEINLRCARKAQATAAAAQALELAERALALLGPNAWSTDYATAWRAQLTRAECEFLRGENERTLAVVEEIVANAANAVDRAAALNLRTMVCVRLGRMLDGCLNSVAALRSLGIELPGPTESDRIGQCIGVEFAAVQSELAGVSIGEMPEMSDPVSLAQVHTLAHAIPATYQEVPALMVLMVLKATRLLLKCGTTDVTPFFLAQYAIAHLAITGDYVVAHRYGKLALEIGLRQKTASSLGAAYFLFSSFTGHWCEPFAKTVEWLDIGFKRCLDAGDTLHATYCVTFAIVHRRMAGNPLPEIRALLPAAFEVTDRHGDLQNRRSLTIQDRLLAALAGEGESPGGLSGGGFDEYAFEKDLPVTHIAWLRAAQAVSRFHAGQFKEALEASRDDQSLVGLVSVIDLTFYRGLSHAALVRLSSETEREDHLSGLSQCLARFDVWADLCPANHGYRRSLLAAALAELRGDVATAMDEYDAAIASAEGADSVHGRALSSELCGEFHQRAGRSRIARLYFVDAILAYEAWGAAGKVQELVHKYPDAQPTDDEDSWRVTLRTTGARATKRRSSSAARSASVALDLESAMRASEAIASELAADKLLGRLLRILVENAGAQRGVLIVPKEGEFFVEAEHTVSPDVIRLLVGMPLAEAEVPERLIRYVARTREALVWNNSASDATSFRDDSYFQVHPPRSALGLPLLHQGQLRAILYLENRAIAQGFSPARLSRLQFLAAQAAAALENSRLYEEVQASKRDLERRVQERTHELQQRNTDLRNVLDTINQGLVTIDRAGRLTGESSSRACAWFGPMTEGRSWFDILAQADPGYAKEFQTFFGRLVREEEPFQVLREKMPRRLTLGRQLLEIDLSPVGSDCGWSRMLVVLSDVTDRDRQAKLEMDLRQAQKLQAIGELAAGIAHEINTPAQFVGDSIEFLASAFEQTLGLVDAYQTTIAVITDEAIRADVAAAEDEADIEYTKENAPGALLRAREGVSRIATIVHAMKEFAHPDHRDKSTADLNRAIETTLTIARNEYKYVADVETHLGDLPPVYCHVGDLNQVFLNLIVNSAHAISDVVGKSGAKGRITVSTFADGATVRIEIADTGCGIPPAIRERVFEPFFTTKEVGRGSGQGLAIARSIVVDKHGGHLSFESEVGKGTTFTIVLPINAPEATASIVA